MVIAFSLRRMWSLVARSSSALTIWLTRILVRLICGLSAIFCWLLPATNMSRISWSRRLRAAPLSRGGCGLRAMLSSRFVSSHQGGVTQVGCVAERVFPGAFLDDFTHQPRAAVRRLVGAEQFLVAGDVAVPAGAVGFGAGVLLGVGVVFPGVDIAAHPAHLRQGFHDAGKRGIFPTPAHEFGRLTA